MASLLESYKGRIALSEKYYSQMNAGLKMSNQRKMVLAQCLNNTAKFMNENFANILPTQMGDMGRFKKFCLDITTVTTPNMIVNDLFMVKPISSISGYITYMQYALGTQKGSVGGVKFGRSVNDDPRYADSSIYDYDQNEFETVIQDPFTWGTMSPDRMRYTSEKVSEVVTAEMLADAQAATADKPAGYLKVAWHPIALKAVVDPATGVKHDFKIVHAGGAEEFKDFTDAEVNGKYGDVCLIPVAGVAEGDRLVYEYDNAVINQNALPTLVGKMKGITVAAHPRRIAINYSQFAAFVSKTDYGIDFESQIAQQAQAELQYETDSECVMMIRDAAEAAIAAHKMQEFKWVDEELDTISYSMKAEGFARVIEQAKMDVYRRTGRHIPNWMVVSPEVMPVLTFVPGFKAASNSIANGPYVAGDVAGMKIIVSPILSGQRVCYLGVLANDGVTAVGGYFPYMPLVPTQLLGFADGTMQQGFSSLYDMKILNSALLGKIKILGGNNAARFFNMDFTNKYEEQYPLFNSESGEFDPFAREAWV